MDRKEFKFKAKVRIFMEEIKDIVIIASFLAVTLGGMGLVLLIINKFGSN